MKSFVYILIPANEKEQQKESKFHLCPRHPTASVSGSLSKSMIPSAAQATPPPISSGAILTGSGRTSLQRSRKTRRSSSGPKKFLNCRLRERFHSESHEDKRRIIWLPRARSDITYFKVFEIRGEITYGNIPLKTPFSIMVSTRPKFMNSVTHYRHLPGHNWKNHFLPGRM